MKRGRSHPAGWRRGPLMAMAAIIGLGLLNWHALTVEISTSPIVPEDAGPDSPVASIGTQFAEAGKPERDSYPETLARPLFRANRRPPEAGKPQTAARPQVAPKQAAKLPDNLELVGIMKENGRAGRALIRLGETAGQWVEVGHVLQGWRLSRIDAAGIAFEAEGREQRLSLFPAGSKETERGVKP